MGAIMVIGDVMLDRYMYGAVERINPEAPVPILSVKSEKAMPGGAANTSNNIASLGAPVFLVGVCGKDTDAENLEELCKKQGIPCLLLRDSERSTTVKQRFIAQPYNHQLLRADYESARPLSRELGRKVIEAVKKQKPSMIVISDYAKGMLTKELADAIKDEFKGRILVDSKPAHYEFYKGVFLLKPNLKEASEILGTKIENNDESVSEAARKLSTMFGASVVITRGGQGATILEKGAQKPEHIPAEQRPVFDLSGAGDTFLAALSCGLNDGRGLREASSLGVRAASIVVGKIGTSTVSKEELYGEGK